MTPPYSDYFKLGINHHLLFPAVTEDWDFHEQTLKRLAQMEILEVVDLFLPLEAERQRREIDIIRASGKEVISNPPLLGLEPGLDPNSTDPEVHERTVECALAHLEAAHRAGARKMNIASGPDPGLSERPAAKAGFVQFLCELGRGAAERQMMVLIEPFDRSIGKNFLIGPTAEAVEIVKRVHQEGVQTVALMLDLGHVHLLNEDIHQAFQLSAPYLHHTHLGSCVKRDPDSEFYGDEHPPLGLAEGECDVPEVVQFFEAAFAVEYLRPGHRATVTLEMQPYPGLSAEESIDISLEKLELAWGLYWSQATPADGAENEDSGPMSQGV
ncbi:MAG: TIM barrel protein [Armatimonadetes bacterium]|nr:TIM barrel protein [Armatimonadota bacterium]